MRGPNESRLERRKLEEMRRRREEEDREMIEGFNRAWKEMGIDDKADLFDSTDGEELDGE